MSFDVVFEGADGGAERFGIDEKRYDQMQVNAVNRAARWVKRVLLVQPFAAATGVRRAIFNDRIRLREARGRIPEARIVPSSHGIPARSYKHRADAIGGSKVRARVLVAWWRGEKVAAGFINPSSARKLPLATRSVRERKITARTKWPSIRQYRYEYRRPDHAHGPSAAALFKVAVDDETRRQAADKLAKEFNLELDEELF